MIFLQTPFKVIKTGNQTGKKIKPTNLAPNVLTEQGNNKDTHIPGEIIAL